MDQEEYILNLRNTNNMILADILSNPSFTMEDLTEVKDRVGALIEQLEFWREQNNIERYCYELRNHIQWMITNYS